MKLGVNRLTPGDALRGDAAPRSRVLPAADPAAPPCSARTSRVEAASSSWPPAPIVSSRAASGAAVAEKVESSPRNSMGRLPQPRRILLRDGVADPRQGTRVRRPGRPGSARVTASDRRRRPPAAWPGRGGLGLGGAAGGSGSAAGRPASTRSMTAKSSAARDRLGQVVVHAGLQAALAITLRRAGGQRDDRQVPARGLFPPPQGLDHLEPVTVPACGRPGASGRSRPAPGRPGPRGRRSRRRTSCPLRRRRCSTSCWLKGLSSATRMRRRRADAAVVADRGGRPAAMRSIAVRGLDRRSPAGTGPGR